MINVYVVIAGIKQDVRQKKATKCTFKLNLYI